MYSDTKLKRKREDIPAFGAGVWRFSRRVVSRLLHWSWLAMKWSAIGMWRGLMWLALVTWKATVWTVALPWRLLRGVVGWWRGPEPYFESERERDIYQRIRRQFRRRNRFRLHTFFYLSVNAAFWLQWTHMSRTLSNLAITNYIALTVITSFFLLFHFLQMRSAIAEDAALEAALNRERYYADQQDSRRYARLTDDGEIVEEDDLDEIDHKRKRR